MKKFAYAKFGCDICGGTVHEHDQMILALVGLNRFIHEALYICPACTCAADEALVRKAKKLKTEPIEVIAITAHGIDSRRAVMARELLRLLSADYRAHLRNGSHFTHVARALRNRLDSRLKDLHIIPVGYYYFSAGRCGSTSEATFTFLELDTNPNLVVLKRILHKADFRDCAVNDTHMLSEYQRFIKPGHGDEVTISLQLVGLINYVGTGVIDIVSKLQSVGLSAFDSVEQCVYLFYTLELSLAAADDYANTYQLPRRQPKL